MRRLPAIACDIDGVIHRSYKAIPGALEALLRVKETKIPFIMLSNGGGSIEEEKVEVINDMLGSAGLFNKDDVILCHTPLKELVPKYRGKWIMTNGLGNCHDIAKHYGYERIITTEEYSSYFPDICPLVNIGRTDSE